MFTILNTQIFNGKQFVDTILIKEVQPFAKDKNLRLDIIWIGDNPESEIYVNHKEKIARRLGIAVKIHHLPVSVSTDDVVKLLHKLNSNPEVTGFFIQLPLPKHINPTELFLHIHPYKDVDGLNPLNQGLLLQGKTVLAPATAAGVVRILKESAKIDLEGKHVVIINDSVLVGKPLAALLLQEAATVTVCNKFTSDLNSITKTADVLISATGKVGLVTGEHLKQGVILIDVGTKRCVHTSKGREYCKTCGDIEIDSCLGLASFITPVPGGVGPVTIAMLLKNLCIAHKLQHIQKN